VILFRKGRKMDQGPKSQEMPIDDTVVRWAYRLILGREPESDQVIADQLRSNASWHSLRRNFLQSPEFQESLPARSPLSLRGDEPSLRIDCEGEPATLQRLFEHINRSWHTLGEDDPFYSVRTAPEYQGLPEEKAVTIFFESGVGDARLFMRALDRNELDLSRRRICLEFGCGLGRITQALAPHFDKTIAVDISAAHLALAEKHARNVGIDGIEWWHLGSVDDLEHLPSVDVIYSMIVLQHNPPPVIDRIIATFARILKPGGIAYFQVPTYRLGYAFDLQNYLDSTVGKPSMEMHVYPQQRVFSRFAECDAIPVSVVEDEATGFETGTRSNTFLFLRREK